jgi:hypothetical protein
LNLNLLLLKPRASLINGEGNFMKFDMISMFYMTNNRTHIIATPEQESEAYKIQEELLSFLDVTNEISSNYLKEKG